MAKQMTIRGITSELRKRLSQLSRDRHQSLNATVLEILERAVGIDARRERLRRYMTWTEEEARDFERHLTEMRKGDDAL